MYRILTENQNLGLLLLLYRRRRKREKYRKVYWVHPLNTIRPFVGEQKLEEMHQNYPDRFFNYTRLSPPQFDILLDLITFDIAKTDTNFRKSIPPKTRLLLTLRYLASGDSLRSLSTSFSMGNSTVCGIIRETSKFIWLRLGPLYVKAPSKEEWKNIMTEYETKWNFPNCLGAIDGKHIMIQAPENTGSLHHNYKGFFLVLLATCDANYRFTTIDVGAYGRESDGGIFARSQLGRSLASGDFQFPEPNVIVNSKFHHPCIFVGDEAFPLSTYLMRPYPGRFLSAGKRIYNYRLSRARRVIENTFGILSSRFRIYRRCMLAAPEHAINVIKATAAFHNFIITDDMTMEAHKRMYCPMGFTDMDHELNGTWRSQSNNQGLMERISKLGSNMSSKTAKIMRENLQSYFMGEGQVQWQFERAGVTI